MTLDADPKAHSGRAGAASTFGVALRIAATLVATAGLSILTNAALADAVPGALLRGGISVGVAGILLGVVTAALVVRPFLRSRADLEVRYQAALADALEDQLTKLGNHRAFQEELDRQVEQAQRYDVPLSLVLIDLDEFKLINDRNGHADGDRTLAVFGRHVAGAVRRVDRAFRIGGDEFALLLPHTDADGAKIVARRLLATSLQPALRDGPTLPISFSAGISSIPALACNRAQLYSQADSAMYAAKRGGRTDVLIFDPSDSVSETPTSAGSAIVEVIARGQLRPVYQPVVELMTRRVLGYEGLIRPSVPAPFIDPAGLFRAAEASGHVVELDFACLETIVGGAAQIPEDVFLSVNLTPKTVEAPEFSTAALLSILARHGFPPERLVIELTEHEPITDVEKVRLKLDTCRRAGMRLAADDLGAGNAGLRLLSELHFDIVKVDLGLVQRSAPGGQASAVVESIVAFATRTGALVIAEGVEYTEQVDQLIALGVPAAQGFLLGRPESLPVEPTAGEVAPARLDLPGGTAAVGPPSRGPTDMASWRQSIGLPEPVSAVRR
ncbi:MAG: bifunctional diguanylate cyclase/phosphodiesterase [Chloroflexota bacterium]|nr:bifunctional diguanylate cyclase/phosphodiesterase [Chloroflexota bacterium]